MATPRKTVTVTEFNKLKKQVEEIAGKLLNDQPSKKTSCLLYDRNDIGSKLNIKDKSGNVVSIGDLVRDEETGVILRVDKVSIYEAKSNPGNVIIQLGVTRFESKSSDTHNHCSPISVIDNMIKAHTVVEFIDKKTTA